MKASNQNYLDSFLNSLPQEWREVIRRINYLQKSDGMKKMASFSDLWIDAASTVQPDSITISENLIRFLDTEIPPETWVNYRALCLARFVLMLHIYLTTDAFKAYYHEKELEKLNTWRHKVESAIESLKMELSSPPLDLKSIFLCHRSVCISHRSQSISVDPMEFLDSLKFGVLVDTTCSMESLTADWVPTSGKRTSENHLAYGLCDFFEKSLGTPRYRLVALAIHCKFGWKKENLRNYEAELRTRWATRKRRLLNKRGGG